MSTFVGDNLPISAREPHDRGYGRMAIDLAASLARAARQRLGEVRRLDIAILWVLDCAYDPINVAKRPDILDVLRGEEPHLDPADRRGDSRVIAIFVHPISGARKSDIGNLAQPDIEASLLLERLVEGDGIFVDLADGVAEIEQRQQAGRMPGRAGGELLALDEHAIRPAFLDEMIKGRNSDHASADHDRPRMRPHRGPSIWIARSTMLCMIPLPRRFAAWEDRQRLPVAASDSSPAKRGGEPHKARWSGPRGTSRGGEAH